MKSIIKCPYYYFEGAIPPEMCDTIIELGKNKIQEDASINANKDVDDSFRKGEVAWIKDEWLQNMIGSYVGLANGNAGWNFILTTKEDVQFATYTDGGFYNWHRDCDINQENYRKLSVSVQLSDYDSYEGGDLLLKHVWGNMRLPMDEAIYKQGTIIVFPSMLLHQVTATTKGTRHSLVQWYSGPDFV